MLDSAVVISNLQATPPSDVALTLISRNNTYTNAIYDPALNNQIASAQDLMYWFHTESNGNVTLLSSDSVSGTGMSAKAIPSRFDGGVQIGPQANIIFGTNNPTGSTCTASKAGSLYLQTNGDSGHTLWVCDDTGTWDNK